jgi:hypothetical protein
MDIMEKNYGKTTRGKIRENSTGGHTGKSKGK